MRKHPVINNIEFPDHPDYIGWREPRDLYYTWNYNRKTKKFRHILCGSGSYLKKDKCIRCKAEIPAMIKLSLVMCSGGK